MTTASKTNGPYILTPTASYLETKPFNTTMGSFVSPKNNQSKFTPLQLLAPVRQKATYHELKNTHSLNNSQRKLNKKHKHKKSEDQLDEIFHKDDQLEFDAYLIKPNTERAGEIFHKIFKNIDTIIQKKQIHNTTKMSVYTSLAQQSRSSNLMPRTLGVVRPNTQANKILDASNYHMGDKYVKVLCNGIKSAPDHFDQVNLRYNNLSCRSSEALKQLIPAKIKGLNLEGNSFGIRSSELMSSLVNSKFGQLQNLNLENNRFNDLSAKQLFRNMAENTKLSKLNLSHNFITDLAMNEFKDLLIKTNSIQEIYLHWNRIHSYGGSYIIQGLSLNSSVRVIDLSFNSLGIQCKDESLLNHRQIHQPHQWGEYLKTSQLVHLDLSNNQFSQATTEQISLHLESNHTLFGFHFSGNTQTNIDHYGFLNCKSQMQVHHEAAQQILFKKQEDYEAGTVGALNYRRIDSVNSVQKIHQNQNEICWICDGWVEHTFYWQPQHMQIRKEPLFVHFSHERYAPVKLQLLDDSLQERSPMSQKVQSSQKVWYIRRMVPSKKKIQFFFSSPTQKTAAISIKYESNEWDKSQNNKKVVFYTLDNQAVSFRRPPKYNYIQVENKSIFEDYGYDTVIHCKPRIQDFGGIVDIILNEPEQIELGEDFFKECHRDENKEFIECFEWDWNRSQLPKILKDEVQHDGVKNYLKSIYRDLVSAYRHYSSISPNGDVWCIPLNCYTDVFSSCLVDKTYQLKDLDINFKQTTSKYINETRNNTVNALLRFQFIEIIVRLAMDKYGKTFNQMNPMDAVRRVYEIDGLQKKFEPIMESQEWRDQFYWTSECNKILMQFQTRLQQLYQIGVGMRQLQFFTSKEFINPSGFREFFNRAGMINDSNAERNVNQAYCLSVQLVVDEVNNDDHMQMDYNSFVEALFRIAEKYGQQKNNQQQSTPELIAQKSQTFIQQLCDYYEIEEDKNQKQIIQMKNLRASRQKTSFVYDNVNHLIYETDGSPLLKKDQILEEDMIIQ